MPSLVPDMERSLPRFQLPVESKRSKRLLRVFPLPITYGPDVSWTGNHKERILTSLFFAESLSLYWYNKSSNQYGGYDPRLVTERVGIPRKTWLYLLRERSRSFTCNGFPSQKEISAPLFACWDHHL
ncbi:hypothetical protein TNCV_1245791 [Trichonephila clavipes]|uniref:Uncharacterized protein n=1 Tax=Trichonephila clavipes TaxID=2585209 RepID=A0A8X6RFA5_TRICX|nr:hypothetical protein TNCV_1245791 [Trichonephila clavipes]